MTCRDLVEFLAEYLSGELTATERAVFQTHLAECPECIAYLNTYQKTIQLGKEAFANPDEEAPDEVPEKLVRAILAARA